MAQPYDRIFNFSAGPSTLPVSVLEQARDEILNYRGSGMSVMEMSHRSKAFEDILARAQSDLAELLGVPGNYKILFLQGGASLQFSMVPMNFLSKGNLGQYVITGTWGKKAFQSGELAGHVETVFDGKGTNYDHTPKLLELEYKKQGAYVHFTSNETIQGVDFRQDPEIPATVVCDMSSNILSRPIDVSRYALIYAGAQKNMGPAGVTVVIMREDLLERVNPGLPPMLDYKVQADDNSLYNTPPCFAIYMCGLVYRHLLDTGGLQAAAERNEAKASAIYDTIDASGGFYRGHAQKASRSLMNVTFTLDNEEVTKQFLSEAAKQGFDGLKGHRSVGGCRASIYNAFPVEGCQALASFMTDFARRHG